MTQDEQREQVIKNLTEMLRHNPFTFEFKVKKRPQGIKVIYELKQEHLDAILKAEANEHAAIAQQTAEQMEAVTYPTGGIVD